MKGTYKPTMAVGMAVVLLSLTLFSCSSEVLSDHTDVVVSDNICFGVSDSYVGTRAGVADEAVTTDRFVLRSSETDDTLCVRAVVSDGIGNPGNNAICTPVGLQFKHLPNGKEFCS